MLKRVAPLLVLWAGCAGGEGRPDAIAASDARADAAAPDASAADANPADVGEDAGSPIDAGSSEDAGFIAEDAGTQPFAHCRFSGPAPAFAIREGERVRIPLSGADLLIDPREGAARLSYVAPGAQAPARSWAVIATPRAASSYAGADGDELLLCTAEYAIRASAAGRLRISDPSGAVLLSDPEGGGWPKTASTARVLRHTPPEERFYGFGEKTGGLDKRGRLLRFWNTDAYDPAFGGFPQDQDPLYLSIPFFVGLRGPVAYGLLTDTPRRMSIDLAQATPERYRIEAEGGVIDQYLLLGPAIADVVRRYAALTGKAELPPRWALGYHQSRWGYSPAARLRELAAEFRSRHIGADALWLDIQHQDGFRSFTFDPATFPDPNGLISDLRAHQFQTVVIADPGIKVDPSWALYRDGLAAGHFLRESNGQPYVGQVWPGDSVFIDFSRPAGRAFWGDQVRGLYDRGVRGVWLDVNEPTTFPEAGGGSSVPNELVVEGDGIPTTMAELHNVYGLLEAKATQEAIWAHPSAVRPFILSRAGYAGIQRHAAVWTGDAPSTWWSLRQVLPMLLGLSLSGVPFVGSDVGGYSGHASPELFARWFQVGAASPFFRGHVTNGVPDQEPWAFGPEVEVISRELIEDRSRLLPYWYSLFAASSSTGAPLLRPLVYEFQADPGSATIDDQAMIGPYVMIAPVLSEGAAERTIYLPPGRWYEARSGAIWDGPQTLVTAVTLAARPSFIREGAILPLGPVSETAQTEPAGPRSFELYPSDTPSRFQLYEDRGEGQGYRQGEHRTVDYRLEPRPGRVRFRAARSGGTMPAPSRALELRIRRADHGATELRLDGVVLEMRASVGELGAEGWTYDADDRAIVVRFSDRDAFVLEIDYDRSIQDLRPPVPVRFRVSVPAATPPGDLVHVAHSSNGWQQHVPLSRVDATTFEGSILLPRGEWFFYKYTRGDWSTVEKWPGCVEATNRYAQARATQLSDQVFDWSDLCQ